MEVLNLCPGTIYITFLAVPNNKMIYFLVKAIMCMTLCTIELGLLFDPEYNSAVPAVAFLSIFEVMKSPGSGYLLGRRT